MNKYLDLITRITASHDDKFQTKAISISVSRADYDELMKELKVLQIIKTKKVNTGNLAYWRDCLGSSSYEDYLHDRSQEGWDLHVADNEDDSCLLTEEEFYLVMDFLD